MTESFSRPAGLSDTEIGNTLNYAYGLASELSSFEIPINLPNQFRTHKVAFEFDPLLLPSQIQGFDSQGALDPTKNIQFQYDALNRRNLKKFAGGNLQTETSFDPASRLLSLVVKNQSQQTILSNLYPQYDPVGNLLQHQSPDGLKQYSYDNLDRLTTAATPNLNENFSYDLNGNMTQANGENFSVDSRNRLQSNPHFNLAHDANGNLTRKEDVLTGNLLEFSYNPENQLTQIIHTPPAPSSPQKLVFTYDSFGRKIRKDIYQPATNSTKTDSESYLYQGMNLILVFDHLNRVKTKFTYGPGIDEPTFIEIDRDKNGTFETQFWLQGDHLGSISGIFDSQGNLVQRYEYNSFGKVISIKDALGNTIADQVPENLFTFTGREIERQTGLMYYRARWYDSELRRFISEDPIWATNLYSYVGNNPVRFIDPYGEAAAEYQEYWTNAWQELGVKANQTGTSIGHSFGGQIGGTIAGTLTGTITGAAGFAATSMSAKTSRSFSTKTTLKKPNIPMVPASMNPFF